MIHMSKQVDYALQLILALAKQKKGEYMSLRAFSQESNISFLFLQRIARSLKTAGMIDATRGVYGGYFLKKNPQKISLKELIEAVDGPFGITACTRGVACPRKGNCMSKKLFDKVNKKMDSILASTSILDHI